jgi:hypothetical protein
MVPASTAARLVPGHLMIGEQPGGCWPPRPPGDDALAISAAGVTIGL